MFKRPVPGFFGFVGETASGKLPALQMVTQAFTTNTLASAGIVRAITLIAVFLFAAFHGRFPHGKSRCFPIVCIMVKQFDQNCFKKNLTLLDIRCTIKKRNWNPIVSHAIADVMLVIISNESTLYFRLLRNLANGTYL
jgi:hypothetical protein